MLRRRSVFLLISLVALSWPALAQSCYDTEVQPLADTVSFQINVTDSPNSTVVQGQTVTVSALFLVDSRTPPTGTLSLYYGETLLATDNISQSCKFTLPTSGEPDGTYVLDLAYSGDGNYAPTTVQTSITLVNSQTTYSYLTEPGSGSTYIVGNNVPLQAEVMGSLGTVPEGTVTFTSGSTVLASGTLGPRGYTGATWNTTGAAPGTYNIVANYQGGVHSAASSSQPATVQLIQQGTTTTYFNVQPAGLTVGQTAALSVYLDGQGAEPPLGKVEIKYQNTTIATLNLAASNGQSTASVNVSTTGIPPGTYLLTANYLGNASEEPSSASDEVTLVEPGDVTVIASPNPVTVPAATFLVATVTVASGPQPTGSVEFELNGTEVFSATLNNGSTAQMPLSTTSLTQGNYTITAAYSGDSNYPASTGITTLTVQ
jgi:hypothetical protein